MKKRNFKEEFFKEELMKTRFINVVVNTILFLILLIPRLVKWEEFELMAGKCAMILLLIKAVFDIIYLCVLPKSNEG